MSATKKERNKQENATTTNASHYASRQTEPKQQEKISMKQYSGCYITPFSKEFHFAVAKLKETYTKLWRYTKWNPIDKADASERIRYSYFNPVVLFKSIVFWVSLVKSFQKTGRIWTIICQSAL